MKKFFSFALVLTLVFSLSTLAIANEATKTITSNNEVKYDYFGLQDPSTTIGDLYPNWYTEFDTTLDNATEGRNPAWCGYTDEENILNGANWIMPTDTPDSDVSNNDIKMGLYGFQKEFKLPATAYNIGGEAGLGADNYGWLYINGEEILTPTGDDERNFDCGRESVGDIPQDVTLGCENVIVAEVQNGIWGTEGNSGTHGPTGVIFQATFTYETPDVEWQPPLTNQDDFALKDGTTLPLKFKLYKQDGTLIEDEQNVYMEIYFGISETGEKIDEWYLDEGVEYLRFDSLEYYYIANFQTKNYELVDGATYTAYVRDGCTDDVLGKIDFVLDATSGKGRGRK